MYHARIAVTFALLLAPARPGWLGSPALGQTVPPAPMQVTSDTPEYCQHLVSRVRALVAASPPPNDVARLSVEGQRMCEHGQTRGGIMRLRKALMLLMHDDDGPGR